MSQKTYLAILKFGIYISFVCIFFVFKNLLFPFITSKQIPFNILMEILFVVWLAFIVKYPVYRPRWSYITFGLAAFLAAITLSAITGIDFNLSFWGDIERMLGIFHVLHFFIFYLIVITVFREWNDWKVLLIISVIVATFVSINGLGANKKTYSTIGNTAYVAGYLLFNIYFIGLLFWRERDRVLRWLYFIPLPILMMELYKTNNTGSTVGFLVSISLLVFLYVLLSKNKKVKTIGLLLFLFIVLFSSFVIINRDKPYIKEHKIFAPFRAINTQKKTFQTRLISWRAAAKDFKNHPILGTGFGNYAVIFDKYFDPSFFEYTRNETYFDRAHNNLIDIGSTSGVVGLLSYLFIFAAAAFYLIRVYVEGNISTNEFIVLSALFTAYFVQNLVVFDSFVTYLSLMIVLAYVYWLDYKGEEKMLAQSEEGLNKLATREMKDKELTNNEIFAWVLTGSIIFFITLNYNIRPWQMLVGTIRGQQALAAGNIPRAIDEYKNALSYHTVLDRDSRTSLIRSITANPRKLYSLPKDQQQEIVDYVIDLAEKNVSLNKQDSLAEMMLAQTLNLAANINRDNTDKRAFYVQRALAAIDAAIAASPGRVPVYFQKAQIQLSAGDKDGAIETLKYATSLSDTYYDSYCNLGKTLLFLNEQEEGNKYIDQCVDLGGAQLLANGGNIGAYIERYEKAGDKERLIKIYKSLTHLQKKNVKNWINLAKLYADEGENDKAREAAEKAMEIDPTVTDYAQEFIDSLKK